MAHFAKLDENNFVIAVNVVNNSVLDVNDEESSGIEFLKNWSNGHENWKQTSYNGKFRYNFAGVGFYYDEINDAFIPPKPNCDHLEIELDENFKWICKNVEHESLA